jgi:hypothetical protein
MLTEREVWDALPPSGFLRSYVEYASQCTDANIAYHLAGGLTMLTQTVPLDYCVPYASPLWGNLYSLIVGDSSKSRKTAAINIARRIMHDAVPNCVGEVPGSQEGLYESLRSQQRQVVVYGEFGEFLAKAEEGYMMPLKTALTNLWDAIPIGRALANSRKGPVNDPRLSLLCGVATDLLERHTEQSDWTGGFLARFLTFFAEPEREFATPPIDDAAKRQAMTQWLKQLAAPSNPPGPCLWLDSQGQQMWNDWYESMRPLRTGANRRAAAACSRATSNAAKVALLVSWDIGQARTGNPWHVGPTELQSALKIADLHLKSVLELGERVTGSRDMRDRATVLRHVSDVPTPMGYILKQSELLKRRVNDLLETLMEERTIGRTTVNGETCFLRTPHMQQALANIMQNGGMGIDSGAGGALIPLRAAAPSVPLIPPEHMYEDLNPNGDDGDEDWSKFEG